MKAMTLLAAAGGVGVLSTSTIAEVLYDNGPVNGVNAYSNATVNVLGERRTLLDDFMVPAGGWTLTDMQWNHVWDTLSPGAGTGAEITIRTGVPGMVVAELNITAYTEMATGNILFSREEVTSWVSFDPLALEEGHYWFEATIVGPENNFWLTADQNFSQCWVNYDGVYESGASQFGSPSDINFILSGIPAPAVLALLGVAVVQARRRRGMGDSNGPSS